MEGKVSAKALRGTAYVPDVIKGEKGESTPPDYNLVSNALKGKAEGIAVSMKDVSPLEHEIKVKLARTDATAPYYKYDFNGDGKVDEEDKIELSYHVNFPGNYPLPWWTNGDVNGDGKIDTDDISAFGDMLESGDESAFEKVNLFEGVTLTNCGINLLDLSRFVSGTQWNGTAAVDTCSIDYSSGVITAKTDKFAFCSIVNTNYLCEFFLNHQGKTFTFHHKNWKSDARASIVIRGSRSDGSSLFESQYDSAGKGYHTFTLPTNFTSVTSVEIRFNQKGAAYVDNTTAFSEFQMEFGDSVSEYEPYKAPETVPVNADGTAIVVGKGESITLSTDAEGATISADYNRDINKAFAELLAKIGG